MFPRHCHVPLFTTTERRIARPPAIVAPLPPPAQEGESSEIMGKGAGKGKGKGSGWFAEDMKEVCCSGAGIMFWGLMILGTLIFIIVFLAMTIEAVDSTEVCVARRRHCHRRHR
jgi:hypothetical protein